MDSNPHFFIPAGKPSSLGSFGLRPVSIWEWNMQTRHFSWHEHSPHYCFRAGPDGPPEKVWHTRVHPDEQSSVRDHFDQAVVRRETVWEATYRCLTRQSSYAWVRDRASIYYNEHQEPIRAVGAITDLSEPQALQATLDKALEVLDHFVYTAAHDLKSPVANLKFLNQLLQTTHEPHKRDEISAMVQTSLLQLDETINGLVEVMQVQSDTLSPQLLRLEDVFQRVIAELDLAGARVEADFQQAPDILLAEAYLVNIMRQLLSNAMKYQSPDRMLTIQLSSHFEGAYLVLTIRDNGIGIDVSRYGTKLFRPFYRFTHQAMGRGIGLYLVKSMAEKNGGYVHLESTVDASTTVQVYLKKNVEN